MAAICWRCKYPTPPALHPLAIELGTRTSEAYVEAAIEHPHGAGIPDRCTGPHIRHHSIEYGSAVARLKGPDEFMGGAVEERHIPRRLRSGVAAE